MSERVRNTVWELIAAAIFAIATLFLSRFLDLSDYWPFILALFTSILLLVLLEFGRALTFGTALLIGALILSGVLNFQTLVLPHITRAIPVETLPLRAFSYEGEEDSNPEVYGGNAWFYYVTRDNVNAYHIDYYLPEDVPAESWVYAGFTFQFLENQNLSDYEAVEVALSFREDDDRVKLLVRDSEGKEEAVTLGSGLPQCGLESIHVVNDANILNYTVPLLPCFRDVNLRSVAEVNFVVDKDLPLGSGSFTINELSLIKR